MVQSLCFTGFYIPEEEYWFPFWTGMTVGERLLSLVLAAATNIGLIATPFVRAPGRITRWLLVGSLVSGAAVSMAWVAGNLRGWIEDAIQYPEYLMRTLLGQGPSTAIYYAVFGLHVYFCARLSRDLLSMGRQTRTGVPGR
jgi:hypothetical protein